MVSFAVDESDVDQLGIRLDRALAATVKQNKVEVKLENLTAENKVKLPIMTTNEIKSFLKYRVREAASRAGVHPGARIKMRWEITREKTGDLKARLVLLGYTDPGLGQIKTASPMRSRQARQAFQGVAASVGFQVFKSDVKAAFLQGDLG